MSANTMKLIQINVLILLLLGAINLLGQSTTAMSFNIRYDNSDDKENQWDKRKEELVELIEQRHPDILGIQEGLYNQVEYIRNNTSNYSYIGVGRDDGDKKGEFSALYYDTTRLILKSEGTFWLSPTPYQVSVGWDASMERICTFGQFQIKNTDQEIYVFNTHFDHIGPKARKKSAKLILSKIKDLDIDSSPLIVMGDLNSEPDSKPVRILTKKMVDPMAFLNNDYSGPYGTFNGFMFDTVPVKRIDYILTSNVDIISYQHIEDKRKNNLCISDHLPVMIVFR